MQFEVPRDTLAEAKAYVRQALETGEMIECTCCTQTVKMYTRRIYRTVFLCLQVIARSDDGLLPREIMSRLAGRVSGNDHCKLAYWGLAYAGEDGRWRCTLLGRDFLSGKVRVPKFVRVFNGTVHGFSEETVSASEIAREFNLPEILDPGNLDV